MANCKNCGSKVDGKFCSDCGQPVDASTLPTNETTTRTIPDHVIDAINQRNETEEATPKSGKAGAIVRLVSVALTIIAYFYSTIDISTNRDWGIGRTVVELSAVFIVIVLVWCMVKCCGFMSPLAKEMWEDLISFSLVGFFMKIGLCLGIILIPLLIFAEYVLPHVKVLVGDDKLPLQIGAIIISAIISVLLVWFDIRKLKK